MIQQLFPGKTRRQIKLKFKSEERHHPFRLSDAITNRAKGITCFIFLNFSCYTTNDVSTYNSLQFHFLIFFKIKLLVQLWPYSQVFCKPLPIFIVD